MKSNNILKVYSIIVTFIAIGLWIETKDLNNQLDEEVEIKYEYSAIIDSLLYENEIINRYSNEKP